MRQLQAEKKSAIEKMKWARESELADINKTFLLRKADVLKENQNTLDELERSLREQQLQSTKPETNLRTNVSLTSQSILEQQENDTIMNDKEVELWKLKYRHLEEKYASLKKELQDILVLVNLQQQKNQSHVVDTQDSLILDNDSANGSGTNSESSFLQPFSYQHQIQTQTCDTGPMDMNGIIVNNTDRLEQALKALDLLKTQITELKREQVKQNVVASVKRATISKSSPTKQHGVVQTHPKSSPKHHRKSSQRKETGEQLVKHSNLPNSGDTHHVVKNVKLLQPKLAYAARLGKEAVLDNYIKVSKSVTDLLHPEDMKDKGDYSHVVEEAKNMIRAQKLKSARSNGDRMADLDEAATTPDSTNWFTPSKEGKLILNNVAERPHSHRKKKNGSHEYPSESSGVGSMRDAHNTEKIKVSTDIDAICASLAHLDEQMKMMWSYVKDGGSSSSRKKRSIYTELPGNLNQPNSGIRRFMESPLTSFTPNNNNNAWASSRVSTCESLSSRKMMDSLKATTTSLSSNPALASAALLLPQNNLISSLDTEYQQFQATKDRIMNKFSNSSLLNPSSGKSAAANAIKEKTKDLKTWLEKF